MRTSGKTESPGPAPRCSDARRHPGRLLQLGYAWRRHRVEGQALEHCLDDRGPARRSTPAPRLGSRPGRRRGDSSDPATTMASMASRRRAQEAEEMTPPRPASFPLGPRSGDGNRRRRRGQRVAVPATGRDRTTAPDRDGPTLVGRDRSALAAHQRQVQAGAPSRGGGATDGVTELIREPASGPAAVGAMFNGRSRRRATASRRAPGRRRSSRRRLRRSTTASPCRSATGAARRSWTVPSAPAPAARLQHHHPGGHLGGAENIATRALCASAIPRREGRACARRRAGRRQGAGRRDHLPALKLVRSTRCKLTATRPPGSARSTWRLCCCSPRCGRRSRPAPPRRPVDGQRHRRPGCQ